MDTSKDETIKDNEKANNSKADLASYVLLKGEKIVGALYAVTTFISDQEPLKWKLREAALGLLSDLSFLRQGSGIYRTTMLERVNDHLSNFIALIDVGLLSGFVSEMNFRILRNECANLKNKIIDLAGGQALEASLRVEMPLLTAPLPIAQSHVSQTMSYTAREEQIKDKKLFYPQVRNTHQTGAGDVPKPAVHNNTRREAIIRFVRGKGWTAIKDIAAAVPDCSVKTVQRELVSLVTDGVLKKQGDRRWSRYLLV